MIIPHRQNSGGNYRIATNPTEEVGKFPSKIGTDMKPLNIMIQMLGPKVSSPDLSINSKRAKRLIERACQTFVVVAGGGGVGENSSRLEKISAVIITTKIKVFVQL